MPERLAPAALVDFDADLLSRATAGRVAHRSSRDRLAHGAMLAKSADVVIVTSRLGGLWDMYGDRILREAGRVGQRVVLTSGWC